MDKDEEIISIENGLDWQVDDTMWWCDDTVRCMMLRLQKRAPASFFVIRGPKCRLKKRRAKRSAFFCGRLRGTRSYSLLPLSIVDTSWCILAECFQIEFLYWHCWKSKVFKYLKCNLPCTKVQTIKHIFDATVFLHDIRKPLHCWILFVIEFKF